MDRMELILFVLASTLLGWMAANRKKANRNVVQESQAVDTEGLESNELRPLEIRRESQLLNSGSRYKVIVNGVLQAKIPNGESLTIQVPEQCELQLLTGKYGATMQIRTGKNAVIHFTTLYGGSIEVHPTNVEVLSIRNSK